MTERGPINQDRLTTPPVDPKLGVGRHNIMPSESSGETPTPGAPKQPDVPAGANPVIPETGVAGPRVEISADQRRAAREAWDRLNAGKVLSLAERRTQEMLIERGIPPMAGGADALPLVDYPDPRLQNIVQEINAEVSRIGAGNPLESFFIQEQSARVRGLLDQGLVDPHQANNLLGELNSWMAEAQAGQRDRTSYRYFNETEEEEILKNEEERERIFEEIFTGVDANPGVEFLRGLSLEAQGKLDYFFTVLNHARVFDDAGIDITDVPGKAADVAKKREQLLREFSGKREIRRILHDANWSATGGGDIQAFAQSMATFQSEHIDLIFQDPLVGTALRMFEQAFQQTKADNNGMLPYEELAWDYKKGSSKLEDKVWALMREEMRAGVAQNVPEWRLRRAIILARGFGVASLRFPEIAAQARLPEETTFASATKRASRFGSIYGEAIARYLDPLEHLIEKFTIGEEDRALLYYFLTGDKARIQSKEQLDQALKMASHLETETIGGKRDKRLIDVINIFRIGGGFSQSSWRTFMSMKDFSPEQRRRAGIGILEGRVLGDVDDEIRGIHEGIIPGGIDESIRAKIREEFAGKSEGEIAEKIEEIIKGKDKHKFKEKIVRERRVAMWKDALKANPLRVMWQWEEKEPGKRVKFLSEALSTPAVPVSEDEARAFLPQVEQDLMIIQENTVRRLGLPEDDPNRITYDDAEVLDYSIIRDDALTLEQLGERRERVRQYVAKIRQEAAATDRDYGDLFGKLSGKSHEQKIKLLAEALKITKAEAGSLLPGVEDSLRTVRDNAVRVLGRDRVTYGDTVTLDYSVIGGENPTSQDLERRKHVRQYVDRVCNEDGFSFIKSLFDKTPVEKSPFPFVIGFEDIPFSDFDFINTGGRGFARRINDYANSVTAANELMGLIVNIPKAHNIGPLIESLDKIKQAVAQYDKSIAMEVVPYLARGIIRMYDKDLMSRMPLGMGTVTGMLSDSSFAQKQYGRAAMAWDEGDKFNFTSQLLHNGLISKKDLAELRRDVGATPVNLTVDILRTYGQLALLLLLYGFAKSVASDK